MPDKLSKMRIPDPFALNQDEVRKLVADYLADKGFEVKEQANDREVDIIADKNEIRLLVEARGSQARDHDVDTVFDSTQIAIHLSEQINQMMRYFEKRREGDILVMANPDIPRIRKNLEKIPKALDKLGIVRMWVRPDKSVMMEYGEDLTTFIVKYLMHRS